MILDESIPGPMVKAVKYILNMEKPHDGISIGMPRASNQLCLELWIENPVRYIYAPDTNINPNIFPMFYFSVLFLRLC